MYNHQIYGWTCVNCLEWSNLRVAENFDLLKEKFSSWMCHRLQLAIAWRTLNVTGSSCDIEQLSRSTTMINKIFKALTTRHNWRLSAIYGASGCLGDNGVVPPLAVIRVWVSTFKYEGFSSRSPFFLSVNLPWIYNLSSGSSGRQRRLRRFSALVALSVIPLQWFSISFANIAINISKFLTDKASWKSSHRCVKWFFTCLFISHRTQTT